MAIKRTEGIVIKAINWRNTSKMVTIFTRDCGKVKMVAKGARRFRGGVGSALELFTRIDVLFYDKPTRSVQTMAECSIIEPFQEIREDIESLAVGLVGVESLDALLPDRETNQNLYELLIAFLRGLRSNTDKEVIGQYFIIRLLEASGYKPELINCVKCGEEVKGEAFISYKVGGLLCKDCLEEQEQDIDKITGAALGHLRFLARADLKALPRLKSTRRVKEEAWGVILNFLHHVLGRELHSERFFTEVMA